MFYDRPMQTVRRQTLVAQVSEQLLSEINAGRWTVGERIPTEPALSEMTGASRHTVREAVQALVHAGLLERRQGSGTYVIATDEHDGALADYFGAARERDLLELREAVEVTATALAARRRSDVDIAELQEILTSRNILWRREPQSESEREDMIEADSALHRAIVAASHNEIYLRFYDLLLPTLRQSMELRPVGPQGSLEPEHTELVNAVIAGDPERAEAAARVFISTLRG